MPHLHLPVDHSDADIVLAATVAEVVGSDDLFIAWTHHSGPGAIPEIEAYVRDERPGPVPRLMTRLTRAVRAFWQDLRDTEPLPRRAPAEAPLRRDASV
jgi:hypothetical protein